MTQADGAPAWRLEIGRDAAREGIVTGRLVIYNKQQSAAVRERFRPENRNSSPVAAYAVDAGGQVIGGCLGRTEDVWQWLTIDTMWVSEPLRGHGVGRALLDAVEAEARAWRVLAYNCRLSRVLARICANTRDPAAPTALGSARPRRPG